MRRRHPFVIGYLLRRVGVRGGGAVGSVPRFGSARLFATRDTINPLTPSFHWESGEAGGRGVLYLWVCARITKEAGWRPPCSRPMAVPGNLATINGAAVEHQFASTNG